MYIIIVVNKYQSDGFKKQKQKEKTKQKKRQKIKKLQSEKNEKTKTNNRKKTGMGLCMECWESSAARGTKHVHMRQ